MHFLGNQAEKSMERKRERERESILVFLSEFLKIKIRLYIYQSISLEKALKVQTGLKEGSDSLTDTVNRRTKH